MKKLVMIAVSLACCASNAFVMRVTNHGFVSEHRSGKIAVQKLKNLEFVNLGFTAKCVIDELYNQNRKHYSLKLAFDPRETNHVYVVRILTIAKCQEKGSKIPYSGMEEPIEIEVDPTKTLSTSPKQIEIYTPWCFAGQTFYKGNKVMRGNVGWRVNGVIIEIVKDGKVVRTWCDNGSSKGRGTIDEFLAAVQTRCPQTEGQYNFLMKDAINCPYSRHE